MRHCLQGHLPCLPELLTWVALVALHSLLCCCVVIVGAWLSCCLLTGSLRDCVVGVTLESTAGAKHMSPGWNLLIGIGSIPRVGNLLTCDDLLHCIPLNSEGYFLGPCGLVNYICMGLVVLYSTTNTCMCCCLLHNTVRAAPVHIDCRYVRWVWHEAPRSLGPSQMGAASIQIQIQ
jgi:hypothetical protein